MPTMTIFPAFDPHAAAQAAAHAAALAAGLAAGHFVGDFVLQTRGMIARKRSFRGLAAHAAVLFLCHAAGVAVLMSAEVLVAIAGVVILHAAIDRLKLALEDRRSRPLAHFVADQLLHLLVLAAAWAWLSRSGAQAPWVELSTASLHAWARVATVVAAFAFLGAGGGVIVAGVLRKYRFGPDAGRTAEASRPAGDAPLNNSGSVGGGGPEDPRGSAPPPPSLLAARGRAIGILERYLVVVLLLTGEWEAIGLVIAAKSIARYRELDDRAFGEYYLIGTLTSLIVAVSVGLLLRWLV